MSGFNLNDLLNNRTKNTAVPLWNFKHIPLEQIVPSSNNKYRICDIEELADSIEVDGLLHNLTVRKLPDSGTYELISGERRFRALQMLVSRGLERFAAAPCKVEVELSDIAARVQFIRANSTARNLTDQERVWQANELKELLTDLKKSGVKMPGRVRKLAADELGISQSQMGRMESISDNLVPEAKAEFEKGNINMTAAYETSRLPVEKQAEVVEDLKRGKKADIKAVKGKRAQKPDAAPTMPAFAPGSSNISAQPLTHGAEQPELIQPTTAPPPDDGDKDTPSCPPRYCGLCNPGDCGHSPPPTHELKTWPEAYDATAAGLKPWEYRLNDRAYEVGDTLHLRRYDPVADVYTGEWLDVEVRHIMRGGQFGIPAGYAIMTIAPLSGGEA